MFTLLIALVGFAGANAQASNYPGYDCQALSTSSSWNCPCGCSYSTSPTPPPNCTEDYDNSTYSSGTPTAGGPHSECSITTSSSTTAYTCTYDPFNPSYDSYYGPDYSSYTSYGCSLTAASCSAGETFLQGDCGCIPGAPACIASGSTPAPINTVSSSDAGSDSGCQRRSHTVTQKILPGFIPGERYSYFSAIVVATSSDTPTTIATKMAAAINAYASHLGTWYSVGFSATSSGDQITIREPWQAGLNQVTNYRPHPICTPTPTPSPTPATTTTFTSGTFTINAITAPTTPPPSNPPLTIIPGADGADFGNWIVGQVGVKTYGFTITNGSPSINATGCTAQFDPPTPTDFKVVSDCTAVPASGSCTVKISPYPSTSGARTGTLKLTCAEGTSTFVTLTENGLYPPMLSVTNPVTNDFGLVHAGQVASPTVTVTVSNGPDSFPARDCMLTSGDVNHFPVTTPGCATIPLGSSTCTYQVTGQSVATDTANTYTNQIKLSCTGIDDPHYPLPMGPYVASTGDYKITVMSPCTYPGQFDPGTGCQCPTGYALTAVTAGQACRPVVPSMEYVQNVATDGYPVCGAGRVPTDWSYGVSNYASSGTPRSDSKASYALPTDPLTWDYPFAYATTHSSTSVNPTYLYAGADRCVCSTTAASNYLTPNTPGMGAGLSTTTDGTTPRFPGDTYDVISTQTVSNGVKVGQVAIATDGLSNGFLGTIFGTSAVCGCPNVNEAPVPVDPGSLSGTYCQTMLNLGDAKTNSFKVLATYNPTIHGTFGSTNTQKFTNDTADPVVTAVKLPTQTQTYQTYNRRIWTCAPPLEPVFSGGSITCQFDPTKHVCDDGSVSGTPSVVSSNMSLGGLPGGATTAKSKFQNTVNKRLACCLNDFDPSNPGAPQKFDCVDNSNIAPDFDTLWKTSIDGVPNAVALTSSSGDPMTGFYALNGTRCSEFSEFAGPIQSAKVNQAISTGQQSNASGGHSLTAIDTTGSHTIAQPDFVAADSKWSGFLSSKHKTIPSTAEQMRRCPILVRAAIRTHCPGPVDGTGGYPPLPAPQQTYFDGTTTRCAAASQIDVVLRVEQIYEIGGMAKMSTIDASSDYAKQAVQMPVSDMIRSKTAGNCPAGSILMANGTCAFQ